MKVDLFDFDLPAECIAQHPVHPRDAARLLVVGGRLQDRIIRDLPELLRPGDLLVFNNTKVIPARLRGKRGEASVEITLHKRISDSEWQVFARPGKKLRVGDTVVFSPDFSAVVMAKTESGEVLLGFNTGEAGFYGQLNRYGFMPLPPYIKRDAPDAHDVKDYQTLFAQHEGAVAAPTAGLHFTPEVMGVLEKKGVRKAFVTLHVGAGTFLPVKVDDTSDHVMHHEFVEISQETAALVNEAKAKGGRIVAVGTTTLRSLESAAGADGRLKPFRGETDIFITPGYGFKLVDVLLTNFHLPRSTLFMLVSAFAGLDRMKEAYAHAIAGGYRFYSYGDACLLYRAA